MNDDRILRGLIDCAGVTDAHSGFEPDGLVEFADAALSRAKAAGRGCWRS